MPFYTLLNHTWAEEDVRLYHFRDKRKNGVDLVLEKSDSRVIDLEVKASATISERDFKGLTKLADYAGQHFEQGVLCHSIFHIGRLRVIDR